MTTFYPGPLRGTISLVGDKSISHRALMLAALAPGTSHIEGLNRGSDVLATWRSLVELGARIDGDEADAVTVRGGTLHDATATLDAGNSGTTARLLLGLCAGAGLRARIDGDESLRRRPMEHVAEPLRRRGARIERTAGRLPATIDGTAFEPDHGSLTLSVPSAQLKSALLLAYLRAPAVVRIDGDRGSRDHTERMLRHFGRTIGWDGTTIVLEPGALRPANVQIPADFSAAAFFIVAATLAEGSDITLSGVGLNPTRTAFLDILRAMGAEIEVDCVRELDGEPTGDLRVRATRLEATSVHGTLALQAIDEIPAFAVAAACAHGRSEVRGLAALRTKESDRIATIVALLRACGLDAQEYADGFAVTGGRPAPPQLPLAVNGDHRIALALAALGAVAGPVHVDDAACIATSFPGFSASWSAAQTPLAAR